MVQSRCVSLSLVPDTENWAAGACASQHTGRYDRLAGKMPARTRQSRPARADARWPARITAVSSNRLAGALRCTSPRQHDMSMSRLRAHVCLRTRQPSSSLSCKFDCKITYHITCIAMQLFTVLLHIPARSPHRPCGRVRCRWPGGPRWEIRPYRCCSMQQRATVACSSPSAAPCNRIAWWRSRQCANLLCALARSRWRRRHAQRMAGDSHGGRACHLAAPPFSLSCHGAHCTSRSRAEAAWPGRATLPCAASTAVRHTAFSARDAPNSTKITNGSAHPVQHWM